MSIQLYLLCLTVSWTGSTEAAIKKVVYIPILGYKSLKSAYSSRLEVTRIACCERVIDCRSMKVCNNQKTKAKFDSVRIFRYPCTCCHSPCQQQFPYNVTTTGFWAKAHGQKEYNGRSYSRGESVPLINNEECLSQRAISPHGGELDCPSS